MSFITAGVERPKTRRDFEDEFFKRKIKWSYSSLTKLLFSPRLFQKEYIWKEKEVKEAQHFSEGALIHALILEPGVVPDKFVVQTFKVPEDKQMAVVKRAYAAYLEDTKETGDMELRKLSLGDYSQVILVAMFNLSYFQALADDKPTKGTTYIKTGDEKRLEKVLTAENIAYFEFLKVGSSKLLISQETFEYCSKAADYIRDNERCAFLLGLYPEFLGNSEIINETLIEIEPDEEAGFKGFLDSLHINHDQQIIYISDLKTTSKPLDRFYRSVQDYLYSLQMAMYIKLVKAKYADLISAGYEIKCHFIVIDPGLQVYAFPVREETMFRWMEELNQAIKKANWHIVNRVFRLPYLYELNLVEL